MAAGSGPSCATRGSAEAATTDGLGLVYGGGDPASVGNGVFDHHSWLDARSAEAIWRELPPPPLAIHGVDGAVIRDDYYVVGGATRAGGQSFISWTGATQIFDLTTLER